MADNPPCPSCGTECVTRRPSEHTVIHECPDCEPEPLSRLLPLALVELTWSLAKAVARFPPWLVRYVYRRGVSS